MERFVRNTVIFLVALCALQTAFADALDDAIAAYNRKDYAIALTQFQALAAQGDSTAQYDLGQMYVNGVGVKEDDAAAVAWFRKAAEKGLAAAQAQLGVMCYLGQGTAQDDAEAAGWFEKAAAQGYVDPRADMVQRGKWFVLTQKTDGKQSSTNLWTNDATGRASYTAFSELDTTKACAFKTVFVILHFRDAVLPTTLPAAGTINVVLNMNGAKTSYSLPYKLEGDPTLIILNGPETGRFENYRDGVLARSSNGISAADMAIEQALEKESSFTFNLPTKDGKGLSMEFPLDGIDAAQLQNMMIISKGC